MALGYLSAVRWRVWQILVVMGGHAKKSCMNTTTWRMTSMLALTMEAKLSTTDGSASAPLGTWERHASDRFATTVHATLAALVWNSLAVDISACARLESTDIIVNTVRIVRLKAFVESFRMKSFRQKHSQAFSMNHTKASSISSHLF